MPTMLAKRFTAAVRATHASRKMLKATPVEQLPFGGAKPPVAKGAVEAVSRRAYQGPALRPPRSLGRRLARR
jgi:hypothetical protein